MGDQLTRLLIVDDEPDVRLALKTVLRRATFDVVEAVNGAGALRAVHEHRPKCVLLDVGLPDIDGWEVLSRIRQVSAIPVMMLTARGQEVDKVQGLELGADDYLTKPFGNAELVARVHALLRRAPDPDLDAATARYIDGWLDIDVESHRVRVNGREVHLTPIEFRVVLAFARHPEQVLSPVQLLALAWDDPLGVGPERVKFTIGRLRKALGVGADGPIASVRGVGYRYIPPV